MSFFGEDWFEWLMEKEHAAVKLTIFHGSLDGGAHRRGARSGPAAAAPVPASGRSATCTRADATGGCTRGVSAERFETPLVGGAARLWRRGGNLPRPGFPPE